MSPARIALDPQFILVVGAVGDDVAAILLTKLQLLGLLGGLLFQKKNPPAPARRNSGMNSKGC